MDKWTHIHPYYGISRLPPVGFANGRMAIDLYLDRRTFPADYPTVCHKPKAGPMTRTISHANTNNPIPIHAPLVLVWTNASD